MTSAFFKTLPSYILNNYDSLSKCKNKFSFWHHTKSIFISNYLLNQKVRIRPNSDTELGRQDSWCDIVFQMYNQSGMGGEGIRPPVSLPSLPLPPDLSRLHQEKALNLQVTFAQSSGTYVHIAESLGSFH